MEHLPVPKFEYLREGPPEDSVYTDALRTWKITFPEDTGLEPVYGHEVPEIPVYRKPTRLVPGRSWVGPTYYPSTREITMPAESSEKAAAWLHEIGHAETIPTTEVECSLEEEVYQEFLAIFRALMRTKNDRMRNRIKKVMIFTYIGGKIKVCLKKKCLSSRMRQH